MRVIFTHLRKRELEGDSFNYPVFTRSDFVLQFFFPWVLFASIFCLLFLGDPQLSTMKIEDGHTNPLFFVYLLIALLQSHLSISTMICHVTKRYYSPLNNRLALSVMIMVAIVFCLDKILIDSKLNIPNAVYIILCIAILAQGHFIINVVNEMANTLRIRVFRVKDHENEELTKPSLIEEMGVPGRLGSIQ